MDEPAHKLRLLKGIKIGVIIMLVVFAAQLFNKTEYWPITRWSMYAVNGGPPATYSDYELIVITAGGESFNLRTNGLGLIASRIITRALDDNELQLQQTYRDLLVERAESTLGKVDISEIQIWERTWTIDPWKVPPFDPENPEQRIQLDEFVVDQFVQEGA